VEIQLVYDQCLTKPATNELEIAMSAGTNYWDCFTGIDLRRTEIASMAWIAQAFCGAALMGYSVQFYQRAGLSDDNAFNMNIGQYVMGAAGTIGSWWLMSWAGRRSLYIFGLSSMLVILVVVGGLGFVDSNNTGASWAIGSLLLIYTFVYDLTVGPVCYCLVAEVPSTRLKIKTVVLARNFYNIGGLINNALMPNMLGLHAWNWGAKAGLFWAGACALLLTWSYFRLVEPKGRTYGELDVLFEHKVSARNFAKTKVDQFSGEHTEIVRIDTDATEKPDVSMSEKV
jgi:SP family general alpha glucoside:H+ symporter-like MFS transporter